MISSSAAFAISAADLYWITPTPSQVMKVPLGGGTPTVAASGLNILGIAVDAKNLYWADYFTGEVLKMPFGGTRTVLVSGQHYLQGGLAVDATNVYWTTWADPGRTQGAVLTVPISGGTPKVLAPGLNNPTGLTANAANLYWSDSDEIVIEDMIMREDMIMTVPKAGGPVTTLALGSMNRDLLFADASHVYYLTDEAIRKVPIRGGPSSTLIRQAGWGFFAVDATSVYWADNPRIWDPPQDPLTRSFAARIMKAPINGGPESMIASFQESDLRPRLDRIAVDATSVYWTMSGGALMKLTPK